MRLQVFECETRLARPRDEVFAFFSDVRNLQTITPDQLAFRILTPLPIEMGTGVLIDYALRLHGIPMKWRTSISDWQAPEYFVDEQLRGPYAKWTHTHRFQECDGVTIMTDRVEYALPFEPISAMARPWVRRQIEEIFAYRTRVMSEVFGPLL